MLGLLCLLQCQLMLLILFPGCGLAAGELETLALLWLTALVGVGLGLGVSATARTSEAAITLIPLLLLPMIMLGGLLFPVADLPNAAARWLAAMMPSRWAFEGLLVTEGAARATTLGRDPSLGYFPLDHRTGYGTVAGVLGGMTLLLLGLAAHTLRRRDIR
jgi:ABC-type multidrug transport system permease subunit